MSQKKKFLYKNIVMQGSFQSAGHTDEYFIRRTDNLIILYSMPRMQKCTNDIYVYEKGKRILVIHRPGSGDSLLYYVNWFLAYWFVLLRLCKKREKWIVFAGHPVFFFFMALQKMIRGVRFAYWVGDFFPGNDWKIRLYESVKQRYHNVIPITYYLSDRINSRMNGGIVEHSISRQTVTWGMKQFHVGTKDFRSRMLAFIGVIKPSQNIEAILEYLYKNPSWRLKLIGICEHNYYSKLLRIISKYSLADRIWFPNTFIPENQLPMELDTCLIGVALYKCGPNQFSWYTDPGKIKTYLEFGLPVIMTDASAVTQDILRFHCGEIMKDNSLNYYVGKIIRNYSIYQKGVRSMNGHYEYSKYYDAHFLALRE